MNLKPLTDHIIVEPIMPEEKTKSGIVLPQIGNESPDQGVVVAVGVGKKDVEMQVKKGDRVIFSKYGPTEAKVEGKKYLILSQDDILAIIE